MLIRRIALDKALALDPPKSPAQKRLMEAAAHTPGGYGGVSQKVGKEFVGEDQLAPNAGAGVQFRTPLGKMLFLRRSKTAQDHPGTWAWPGGGREGDETPQETARRETEEEIGHAPKEEFYNVDHEKDDEKSFTTFGQSVPDVFEPKLNDEHDAYDWRGLDELPSPLHPGVARTLEKMKALRATDCDLTNDAAFAEEDHPRDDDGKFGSGGSGGGAASHMFGEESSFTPINEALRGEGKIAPEIQSKIDEIDVDFKKNGKPVPAGTKLYRGISLPADSQLLERLKPGKNIQDLGYIATSSDKKWAEEGMKGNLGEKDVLFNITPSETANPKSLYNAAESEYLFPRGSYLIIKSANEKNGQLHVDAVLTRLKHQIANDGCGFDHNSVRRVDPDTGHLHVSKTNITKANVCPYVGKEIPDWDTLGLDPEKIYYLYRHPDELNKAVASFNNIPLLRLHKEISADNHSPDDVIGTTGSEAEYNHPYIQNSLGVWDGEYIKKILNDTQKELSSAYRYRADMTPGVSPEGQKYDGVMRDIRGNHVATVKEGRAGSDVTVGDSKEELNMSKHVLSIKAVMARGAIAAFLAPKLAADAKIPLTSILGDINAANFKEKLPSVLKKIDEAIKGKLAKDEKSDGLAQLLDALSSSPVVDDGDPMDDANFNSDDLDAGVNPLLEHKDNPEPKAKDGPMDAIKQFLAGKLSPEDMAQLEKLCSGGATDSPPPFGGMPKPGGGGEQPPAKDKDMVSKEDADKMVKGAEDAAVKRINAIHEAKELVRPYIGAITGAFDSATDVLKKALIAMDVKGCESINDENALKVILAQQKKPGEKVPLAKPNIAKDAASRDSFAKRYPNAARIGHV